MHDKNAMKQNKPTINEEWITYADDEHREYLETIKTPMYDFDGNLIGVLGIASDITNRSLNETINKLRAELLDRVYKDEDKYELLQVILDKAEEWTQSQIAFFHLVEEDEGNVSLQTWSTNTLEKMCFAEGNSSHYPVAQAGVWVDCIHQRKSVVYNDYESLTHKKGLPEGHAPLTRFISSPHFRNSKVVAIMGVGNKLGNYNDDDVDILEKFCELAYDIADFSEMRSKLQQMAYFDLLTDLPNRTLVIDRLSQTCSLSKRNKSQVVVCYLDLDGFKPVNDQFGHHVGDGLLKAIGLRLNDNLREGDTIARMGGDEFVIIFSDIRNTSEVHYLIERTLNVISAPYEVQGNRVHVSASIGATIYPVDKSDPETLIRHADHAMYKAKEMGQSQYVIFEPTDSSKHNDLHTIQQEFKDALQDNDELELYYQPKVELSSGKIFGFESLIRWNHPDKGFLTPAFFLSAIQETSQELLLGEWVVSSALKLLKEWKEKGYEYELSVNIVPRQLQQKQFGDFVESLTKIYDLDLFQKLELEILELASVNDTVAAHDTMTRCKSLGIKFSLDDFGTGYSSLAQLHRLPIDILKIDQKFIKELLLHTENLDIVEGILLLAKSLDKPVIAEGVESDEIGFMLLEEGCQFAQGYCISKPLPLEELDSWIISWNQENFWSELDQSGVDMQKDFAVNVAIYIHSQWFESVLVYLNKRAIAPELNEKECQFYRWYHSIGKMLYLEHEVYPFLQAKHFFVHEVANKLIKNYKMTDKIDNKLLSEFISAKDEFIDLLNKLKS